MILRYCSRGRAPPCTAKEECSDTPGVTAGEEGMGQQDENRKIYQHAVCAEG